MSEKWVDPIVEEVRRIRQEYAAEFDYDLEAIFEDVRKHQEEARKAGAVIISAPLRPAARHVDGSSADPAA